MENITKPKFIKSSLFYKNLLIIALPIMLQNMIVYLTQMLDTLMLGSVGQVSMSAASLANQPFFLFNMLVFGIGSGAAVLTAQYWGKGAIEPIKAIVAMIIRFAVVIGFVAALAVYLLPVEIMSLFTKDTAVIEEGVRYLKIICLMYPIFGFFSVYYTSIRSVESVIVAAVSNFTALIVNGFLNYILIFGKLGIAPMGIEGAAWATVIARCVEFSIALIYMFVVDKKLNFNFKSLLAKNPVLRGDLIKISSPVVANELMWSMGIAMQAALLGRMSTVAVAANSIVSVVQQLATVAAFGLAASAAILIGKSIGEGNIQDAHDKGFTFNILAILIGVLVFVLILISKTFAIDFYNVSPEAKALAHQLIVVAAVVGFFVSLGATGIVGVLRGGGDTQVSLFIEIISLWCVAVPLAYFCAFVLHWNVVLVYIVMKIDEPVKCILYLLRIKSGKWIKDVTR